VHASALRVLTAKQAHGLLPRRSASGREDGDGLGTGRT